MEVTNCEEVVQLPPIESNRGIYKHCHVSDPRKLAFYHKANCTPNLGKVRLKNRRKRQQDEDMILNPKDLYTNRFANQRMSSERRSVFLTDGIGGDEDDDGSSVQSETFRRLSQFVPISNGQREYKKACKRCAVIPLSVFTRQLCSSTISLKYQHLTENAIKTCAIGLLCNRSVKYLDFEGCNIGPAGAKYLCQVLEKRDDITELNLKSNAIGTEGLKCFVKLLTKNFTLHKLDISNNYLKEKDAIHIKSILESDNSLRELRLSHNSFCDRGGCVIATGIINNEALKVLDISWNHLRGNGAAAVGYSLKDNHSLEVLNLSWNGFDVPGCHGLGHGLEKNSSLKELDLCANRVGQTALLKLLEGMKHNSTLEVLKIADNPLTAEGAYATLVTIQDKLSMKHLDIGTQPVDEEFIVTMKDIQKTRKFTVTHGKVYFKVKKDEGDPTMFISGDPMTILLEFTRMKEIRVLDLFLTFDTDGSHSVTWDEFRQGVQFSHIPVRTKDIDALIRRMDLDLDGEISFTELVIAQKEHNRRVKLAQRKGVTAFNESEIGKVHNELKKWFHDKDVYLKNYSMFDDERIGGVEQGTNDKAV